MQSAPITSFSSQQKNFIILIILSLYPLIGMGVDLLAPSLPAISSQLIISTATAKNLIAIYFFGYALGNLFISFLADNLGRRQLILCSLSIFTIASLIPALFQHIFILLLARFIQGFTIAILASTGRALFTDILSKEKIVQLAPIISAVWGIGPIIGPVIGGYLQYYFNWPAGFYFFALYSFIALVGCYWVVPETHLQRQAFAVRQTLLNFKTILSHRAFIGFGLLTGLTYALLVIFNTLGPFLIQTTWGHTAIYFGHIALMLGVAFLLGTLICRYLVKRYSPQKLLLVNIMIFFIITMISVILAYLTQENIALLFTLGMLMFLASGIISPICLGQGMTTFPQLAGSGVAIMNLLNLSVAGITAFLMGFINATSLRAVALCYLGVMLCAGLIYWLFVHSKTN